MPKNAQTPDPSDGSVGAIGEGENLDDLQVPGLFDPGAGEVTQLEDDSPEDSEDDPSQKADEETPDKKPPKGKSPLGTETDTSEQLSGFESPDSWKEYLESLPENQRDAAQKAYGNASKHWQGAYTKARQSDTERLKSSEQKATEYDQIAGLMDDNVVQYLMAKQSGKSGTLDPAGDSEAQLGALVEELPDDPTIQDILGASRKQASILVERRIDEMVNAKIKPLVDLIVQERIDVDKKAILKDPVWGPAYSKHETEVEDAVRRYGISHVEAVKMVAADDVIGAFTALDDKNNKKREIPHVTRSRGGGTISSIDKAKQFLQDFNKGGQKDHRLLDESVNADIDRIASGLLGGKG